MSTDDSTNLPGDVAGTSPIQDRAKQDLSSATTTAKQDLSSAAEAAKHDLDAIARKAADDVAKLKQQAGAQLSDATDKAKSFASEQKNFAAGQISGVATAITRVADELEGGEQQMVARYARDLASGLTKFGNEIQNKDVDDLMGMAQNFGRSQPLAFLGAAALTGFIASRFALASAHRRDKTSPGQFSGNQSNTYSGGSAAYGTSPTPSYGSAGISTSGSGAGSTYGNGTGSSLNNGTGSSTGTGSTSTYSSGTSSFGTGSTLSGGK